MKIIIVIFFLLFIGCFNLNVQVKRGHSLESQEQKTLNSNKSVRHKSYKIFIDSLIAVFGITYSPSELKNTLDTFDLKNGNFKVINTMGNIKQYYYFFGLQKNSPFQNSSDSCYSYMQFGSHKWLKNNSKCQLEIKWPEKSDFVYHNNHFVYRIGTPMNNCIGSLCRVVFYPVFGITERDTSLYVLENADDITGLKYGDLNKDKYLDFLVVKNFFSREDLKNLIKKDLKRYQNWDCANSQCYKITAITFKNGKWEILKDSKGKEYYFLILINDALNPESSFELLDSYWI
jgi:hypothetical protein